MEQLDKAFIEMYQKIGKNSGLDNLTATLFGMLYLEPKEIAMEDLAKKTGYSLASVSNKLKFLEQFGLITRKSKPGTRKIFLYMDKDLIKLMKGHLIKKEEQQIKFVKKILPGILDGYKKKAKTEEQKNKLKIMQNYHDQLLKFEKVIKLVRKEIEKIG